MQLPPTGSSRPQAARCGRPLPSKEIANSPKTSIGAGAPYRIQLLAKLTFRSLNTRISGYYRERFRSLRYRKATTNGGQFVAIRITHVRRVKIWVVLHSESRAAFGSAAISDSGSVEIVNFFP
jgi:hypothetical protein